MDNKATKEQREGRQKDFQTEKWDWIAAIMHKGYGTKPQRRSLAKPQPKSRAESRGSRARTRAWQRGKGATKTLNKLNKLNELNELNA